MRQARRLSVSGRVQGVGFRAYVADVAREENLSGWVRNLPDGRVEMLMEGDAEALSRVEWRVWRGPAGARVDDVETEDVMPEDGRDFRIRS